jgi:hypothetical protein
MSKRNEVICDICGTTVATIEGAIFKKALTSKPYITVPFHFVRTVVDEWDLPEKEYCKSQKHICLNCYNHIARELKILGGKKDE